MRELYSVKRIVVGRKNINLLIPPIFFLNFTSQDILYAYSKKGFHQYIFLRIGTLYLVKNGTLTILL